MLSWPEFHGAVTHFPVALLLMGAAFDIGAVLFRKAEWRVVSFWMLVAAVVMAIPALVAGLMTANALFAGPAQPPPIVAAHRTAALATALVAGILLAWRVLTRDRLAGAARYSALLLSLTAAASVGYTGFLGGRMVFGDESQTQDRDSLAAQPDGTASGRDHASGASPDNPAPQLVARGMALFQSDALGCTNCHSYQGKGAKTAPDLTDVGLEHGVVAWHVEHLKDPRKVRPGSTMPSYGSLKEDQLRALAAFLATRRGDAPAARPPR